MREGERENSFRPFLGDRVGGAPLSDFLVRRTALLLVGAVPEKVEKKSDGWDIRLESATDGRLQVGLGSAIPLSKNGYFLTAAHNLSSPPFTVAILKNGGVEFAEAKVVWSGHAEIPEEDFAIVQARLHPGEIFEWEDSDAPTPGMAVVSMSGPHGRCGGSVLEISRYSNPRIPCAVLSVTHDLPLLKGDSGGPVVGRDGRLVGMNVL